MDEKTKNKILNFSHDIAKKIKLGQPAVFIWRPSEYDNSFISGFASVVSSILPGENLTSVGHVSLYTGVGKFDPQKNKNYVSFWPKGMGASFALTDLDTEPYYSCLQKDMLVEYVEYTPEIFYLDQHIFEPRFLQFKWDEIRKQHMRYYALSFNCIHAVIEVLVCGVQGRPDCQKALRALIKQETECRFCLVGSVLHFFERFQDTLAQMNQACHIQKKPHKKIKNS
jgi:hypothetical protein